MKTSLLERKVRGSLIQKRVGEACKLMETPEYQAKARDVVRTIMGSFFNALDDELGDENLSSELMPEIDKEISKLFSNPEQLRQNVYKGLRDLYITREQLEARHEKVCETLKKCGDFNDEAILEFEKANEKVYGFIDYQDRIVSGLVRIAEKDGIKKAVTDKAEHEIIREIFPTADEYIAYSIEGIQAIKEYLANVQKAMMMDGEVGRIMGALYGGYEKIIQGMQGMNEQIEKDRIHQKAKEIYGISSPVIS